MPTSIPASMVNQNAVRLGIPKRFRETPSRSSLTPAAACAQQLRESGELDLSAFGLKYPDGAVRAGHQGRVVVELAIDESGRTSRCTILQSSGFASLDAGTCRQVYTRRLPPGKNAAGKPRPSVRAGRMVSRLHA